MSVRKEVVERYIDGFRKMDHAQILSCITDDVVWVLHGYTSLEGKDAFDREIANPEFTGAPKLTIEQLVEEGDTVVAVGAGEAAQAEGGVLSFVFCDVFTFGGDQISRLETYQVNLS